MQLRSIIFILLAGCSLVACKKYTDEPGRTDPRISRPFCNDPSAINYNWDFPGTPDSTVCFYGSDVFKGQYSYQDSIYTPDNKLARVTPVTMKLFPLTHYNIAVTGFCDFDSLRFTANRNYIAFGDTTIGTGQQFCNIKDTMSGSLTKYRDNDSIITVSFTVVSDTGTTYHRGTAYKQ